MIRSPADRWPEPREYDLTPLKADDIKLSETIPDIAKQLLSTKFNASKRYVYRCFDNAVRGNTVVYPGEADAVVVKPIKGSNDGLATTMDSNIYGEYSPYVSGAYAVAESVRNVVSVGAEPIALTDCLNYGNPENPPVFFDFQEGVKGIKDAATETNCFGDTSTYSINSGLERMKLSAFLHDTRSSVRRPSSFICELA